MEFKAASYSAGDTDLTPPVAAAQLQPPQLSQIEAVPPLPGPSPPAGQRGTQSDVTEARTLRGPTDVTEAAVAATPSEVTYEGWHKMWESAPHGLPEADVRWMKEDAERGLFHRQTFLDKHGNKRTRKVLKSDRMWFHPPESPGVVLGGGVPSAHSFFHSRVFFWRPVGVWGYSLRCPRSNCPARDREDMYLYHCGYSKTVRQICHMSGWYSMLTEVLACQACRNAAKESSEHAIGRSLAWDAAILNQLTPAHRAVFPAVLTLRRGVDKQVIRLMRDRTLGNTMAKVWRQVQESHCEEYLLRKDLYTTLLSQLNKPGILNHQFQRPPSRRELPTPTLLRKTFLLAEADNIEDYRTQIMSTFGKVLKYDSTRKICKKLSGDGKGTAEWCTNVANELGQILMTVLTCEESLDKLRPMAEGLMERYRRAGEAPPELMYVDRGCCRVHGVSSLEQLFSEWADSGMLLRLDVFHWIHRFDAPVRSDHHAKYGLFKSALSAAVFAYNKEDMALLIQAIRAGRPSEFDSLTDAQIIENHVSKNDLQHFVRRITVGALETFARVQNVIDILKGSAGMDENQVHLFKDAAVIDHVWENQQKHLECLQDPPGRDMYTITKYITRNGVRLPYYTTVRGSNSLEGFHSYLPSMIPGPHCAAVPFQVYLLSGIARWNSDRESASVKGQKGRKNMVYVSPLIHRLNQRCQDTFGEVEEANYRPPVPAGDEKIGLEYLFAQSSEPFSAPAHYAQARETLQAGEDEDEEGVAAEAHADTEGSQEDDVGYNSDSESDNLTPLKKALRFTDQVVAPELDPCVVTVDDPVLSKLGIPILKVNSKCVAEFIRRQEALSATNVTDQGLTVPRRHQSVASMSQPPAAELPDERPHTARPQVQYLVTPSLAGTKKLKQRLDLVTLPAQPSSVPVLVATAAPPTQPPITPILTATAGLQLTFALMQPSATPSTSVAAVPMSQVSARSTFYKRKKALHSGTGGQKTVKLYTCVLCGQSTQGHKKYRKKTYCQKSKSSTSKGLAGQTFETFADFQKAVDEALGPQS